MTVVPGGKSCGPSVIDDLLEPGADPGMRGGGGVGAGVGAFPTAPAGMIAPASAAVAWLYVGSWAG